MVGGWRGWEGREGAGGGVVVGSVSTSYYLSILLSYYLTILQSYTTQQNRQNNHAAQRNR